MKKFHNLKVYLTNPNDPTVTKLLGVRKEDEMQPA
jgi:hypothetical protein